MGLAGHERLNLFLVGRVAKRIEEICVDLLE
jgi:hypothetical protein